ncbi:hypothetical protein FACS1894123_01620 [Bacteroidia bacterium]|nr:hypothetical protein FACS1894123_01620 [Bacteroidia bacterium]
MRTHFFKHVLLGLAAIAGFSAVVMLLWNALVPTIFGLTVINFWQSLGLLALARLLFGGFGGKGIHCGGGGFEKNPIREKWEKMTPEERKEFLKNRHFGHHGHGFGHNFRDEFFKDESTKEDERG